MYKKNLKKVFILAGEVSGDQLAAWYYQKVYAHQDAECQAIGGSYLAAAGVFLFDRYDDLNVIGLTEIIPKIPFFYRYMHRLVKHLRDGDFDELVLVDSPGFNLRFARLVRSELPQLRIVYAAPPQLWCWGAWRLRQLRKVADELIVLYPFEVDWYAQRGVRARYIGSPVVERVAAYRARVLSARSYITIAPGSRATELFHLLPIVVTVAQRLRQLLPNVVIVILCAPSYPLDTIKKKFEQSVGTVEGVLFVVDEQEKYWYMRQSIVALAKPGTVTLELALLQVPTVLFFKTSWLNNFLARCFMRVAYRGLPNLLTKKELVPEFIQNSCTAERIASKIAAWCGWYLTDDMRYNQLLEGLDAVWQAMHIK